MYNKVIEIIFYFILNINKKFNWNYVTGDFTLYLAEET